MTVIPGEGRVSILYGNQPMALPPHRDGYVARPDASDVHPAVVIAALESHAVAIRTIARHLARYGYAVVVPPAGTGPLDAAVAALGSAWGPWARSDRVAVIGIGAAAGDAATVAGDRGLPLVLLSPEGVAAIPSTPVAALVLAPTDGIPAGPGRRVTYGGVTADFWDDTAAGYAAEAATDALRRIVEFLDRHLAVAAAA